MSVRGRSNHWPTSKSDFALGVSGTCGRSARCTGSRLTGPPSPEDTPVGGGRYERSVARTRVRARRSPRRGRRRGAGSGPSRRGRGRGRHRQDAPARRGTRERQAPPASASSPRARIRPTEEAPFGAVRALLASAATTHEDLAELFTGPAALCLAAQRRRPAPMTRARCSTPWTGSSPSWPTTGPWPSSSTTPSGPTTAPSAG